MKAGAAAVMCGYNQVNGTHVCGNDHILNQHLKGAMGFEGFVMSDWWAVHDANAAAGGVDQNMPGNDMYFSLLASDPDPAAAELVDGMARRVLRGMIGCGALDSHRCTLGCDCGNFLYNTSVTSAAHSELAVEIASGSAVLLKNEGRGGAATLPIQPGATVALVGRGCSDDHAIDPCVGEVGEVGTAIRRDYVSEIAET